MAYTTAEGRQRILRETADAIDEIALSMAYLGEAYELLDDATADRLEEQLFGPVQQAYGRAKRTIGAFEQRTGEVGRELTGPPSAGLASQGAKLLVERAAQAAGTADSMIADLQDSMLPAEVGDAELVAGLAEVRRMLDVVPVRAAAFARTFGR